MPWPTSQDYNEAIQNPQVAFDDPSLKAGKPELDARMGLPRVRTGQFACVYKMQCGTVDWATRCFSYEVRDQQERYKAIDDYLSLIKIPQIVGFDYLVKGIFVRGQWRPLVRMEWVHGVLLSQYVESNLSKPAVLRQLAAKWVEMLKLLQSNSIAHGDLQHGNVLVVGDELKLVDYDGMFVPTLQGRASPELGHQNYQHPNRKETDFGPSLDNFSAWVVYVSLVALSSDPSLWAKTQAGDDCLLFRKADFEQPSVSRAFALLIGHRDPNVRTLAALFRSMLFVSLQQVPPLAGQMALATQSDAINVSSQTSWWADHRTSSTQPQPGRESLRRGEASATAASWILDFVTPPENLRKRYFRQPRGARLLAILSLFVSLGALVAAVLSVRSSTLPDSRLYSDILIVSVLSLAFIGDGCFNLAVSVWYYLHDPSVLEKRTLSARARQLRAPLTALERELAGCEKTDATLKNAEDLRRKELDAGLRSLQEQERKEIENAQRSIILIAERRSSIDREESEALGKLNATAGLEVNALRQQIDSVVRSEASEISRALATIQKSDRDDYLKRYPIAGVALPGLRYSSRSSLESALITYGIRTAYDISYTRVDAVPGFGPKRTAALVGWRQGIESQASLSMPRSLSPSEKSGIQAKYAQQKKSLEIERDAEQARLSSDEKAIRDRSRSAKQSLELEESTARTRVSQQAAEINQRFAQQYLKVAQAQNQSAQEFVSKHREVDDHRTQIRQNMFGMNWQLAKLRHQYSAYGNLSFFNYLKFVYFGVLAK